MYMKSSSDPWQSAIALLHLLLIRLLSIVSHVSIKSLTVSQILGQTQSQVGMRCDLTVSNNCCATCDIRAHG